MQKNLIGWNQYLTNAIQDSHLQNSPEEVISTKVSLSPTRTFTFMNEAMRRN